MKLLRSSLWGIAFIGAYQLGVILYRKAGIHEIELFVNKKDSQ